jgi:hypothetical protein
MSLVGDGDETCIGLWVNKTLQTNVRWLLCDNETNGGGHLATREYTPFKVSADSPTFTTATSRLRLMTPLATGGTGTFQALFRGGSEWVFCLAHAVVSKPPRHQQEEEQQQPVAYHVPYVLYCATRKGYLSTPAKRLSWCSPRARRTRFAAKTSVWTRGFASKVKKTVSRARAAATAMPLHRHPHPSQPVNSPGGLLLASSWGVCVRG